MARVPSITRDILNEESQQIYDDIASSRGHVAGPYGVLLHSPELARCVAALGAYVRFQSVLPPILREVAILTTTLEAHSQYGFTAHVQLAREASVPESTIDAIRTRKAPNGLNADEASIVRYTQELLRNNEVSDESFKDAERRFGLQGVADLTGTIGHYLVVGTVMAAFQVELPDGVFPELP